MKKKILVTFASTSCLMLPMCLNVDTNGLLGLGGDILCNVAISGLPGAGYIDYCSVVDIDPGADWNDGE